MNVWNTKYTSQPVGTQANFVSDTVCIRECMMAGVNLKIKKKREEKGKLADYSACSKVKIRIAAVQIKRFWRLTSRQQVHIPICAVSMRNMRRHSAIIDIGVWVHEKRRRKKNILLNQPSVASRILRPNGNESLLLRTPVNCPSTRKIFRKSMKTKAMVEYTYAFVGNESLWRF